MKKYILTRLVKSIISILIVVSIVVIMVYKLVPISKVFENDDAYRKLKANQKDVYSWTKLKQLGYLDYYNMAEMAQKYSENPKEAVEIGSEENKRLLSEMEKKGYTVKTLDKNDKLRGSVVAIKYYNSLELIGGFFKRLISVDNKNAIQDENNPDMERKYYWGKTQNGLVALQCEGCKFKNQLYFNGSFPFIHQNKFRLNFGESFPMHKGIMTLDVIGKGQGSAKKIDQKFPTGYEGKEADNQYSRQYKYKLTKAEEKKYGDNYADVEKRFDSPSMIGTSYLFGICSLILTYLFALPFGVAMARNKGKFIDKLGIVYINLLIAVPSLAFIFFMKYLGNNIGLPDKFAQLGFGDIRSYILPIVILALLSTPSLMMWIRRYMVDQQNADYVKFAKAKGLTKREISKNHILKNAIIPIVNGIPGSII